MTPRDVSGGARVASVFDTLLVLSRSLTGAKQGGVLADALDLLLAGAGCARGAAYATVGDALELVGERGLHPALREPLARLPLADVPWFVAQKAARARKVVADRDLAENDDGHLDRTALALSKWAQAVACPITMGREVYGVIVLAWPALEEPDYLTLALLEVACAMLALSMARRNEEHRRSERRSDDVHAARLAALGVIARGFAEDLGAELGELAKRVGEPLRPARDSTARFLAAVEPSAPERINLGVLVADSIALAEPHLRRRGIGVQLRSAGQHLVVGRRRELTQLFLHIVLGAAGVIDDEDDVRSDRSALVQRVFVLDVVLSAGHEVVRLSDATGEGSGARASFFDLGRAGDHAFDLSVARRIVIAHEGHIEIGPIADSPSTRCSVVLPAAGAESRASRPALAPIARGALPSLPPPVVLWIDDDDLFLEIMVQTLSDLDVRVARSATEAMQLLTFGVRPCLVFCNVRLEGRPGHEVHAEITRHDRSLAERFIFVADGVVTPEIASYLIASGRPTLMRPINVDQVRAMVERDPATLGRAAMSARTLSAMRGRSIGARTAPDAPAALSAHGDARRAPTEPARPALSVPVTLSSSAPGRPVTMGETPKPPARPVTMGETPKPPARPVEDKPVSADRSAVQPPAVSASQPPAAPDPAEEPVASKGRGPSRVADVNVNAIARAVADSLRREGSRRAAIVVAMLLERGLSEHEALSVISFGLSNALFIRDPPPSTMLRVPGAERKRVLVVDDDFDLRQTLREILQDEGYVVETASDGRAALEVLRQSNPPRAVVLDLMMPVMDGWQLLDELERDHALADIPVVVISASKAALRSPSAHEFLAKPIDYHKLIATIDRSMKAPARRAPSIH